MNIIRWISICALVLCFETTLEAKNQALLIGIGDYDKEKTGWSVIHGNNDVSLLSKKLKAKGFMISTLMSATRESIRV